MVRSRIIICSVFLLLLAGSAGAQEEGARELYRSWIEGQRTALASLSSISVIAQIEHRVATNEGERMALMRMKFTRGLERDPLKGEIQFFRLNEDTLDVSERKRIERSLSSMMIPELGPLLNGMVMPLQVLNRSRGVAPPRIERMRGRTLMRYVFTIEPPNEDRPRFSGRIPPRGRRQGGPPNAGRRPGNRPDFRPRQRPEQHLMIWLDTESGELTMSRIQIRLPGGQEMVAETRFIRIDGIDMPLHRTVKGTFPLRRRLRTITVSLNHVTNFSDFRLR